MAYTQTLILNQFYRPHEIVDWKDAVTRMITGKIEVIVQYDEILAHFKGPELRRDFPAMARALRNVIGSDVETIEVKVPAVAVLLKRVRQFKTGVKFSRINLCMRDDFKCQYCGTEFRMSELTYDHVVPRKQGGKTVWNNIVMACYKCNGYKGNRTPEQAGMPLLSVPTKPEVLPMNDLKVNGDTCPEEWRPFIVAA